MGLVFGGILAIVSVLITIRVLWLFQFGMHSKSRDKAALIRLQPDYSAQNKEARVMVL